MKVERYYAGPGAQYSDQDAEKLAEVLEEIGTEVAPLDLVNRARPKASPIHHLFEWNEKRAAESFRVFQARQHINHLKVRFVQGKRQFETKAYHSVVIAQGLDQARRAYQPVPQVVPEAQLRQQVIDNAWLQLLAWRRRYEEYKEVFGDVFAAIEAAQQRQEAG